MTRALRILALLALSPLAGVWTACGPQPSPVPPPAPVPASYGGQGTGGAMSTGGSTLTGGSSSAAGATSVAYYEPECSNARQAAPRVRPNLSGWRRDPKRAITRKVRASYDVIAPSVFLAPNVDDALDQGSLGSCTGNAVAQCLSTQPFAGRLTEWDAVEIYKWATANDPFPWVFPPTDEGSNGAAAARGAKALGYTTLDFTPVLTVEGLQMALQTAPCVFGTEWPDGYFTPTNCGELQPTGAIAGGHEIEIVAWNADRKIFWIRNSWGKWGLSRGAANGYAYLPAGEVQRLLNVGGEIDCPVIPRIATVRSPLFRTP